MRLQLNFLLHPYSQMANTIEASSCLSLLSHHFVKLVILTTTSSNIWDSQSQTVKFESKLPKMEINDFLSFYHIIHFIILYILSFYTYYILSYTYAYSMFVSPASYNSHMYIHEYSILVFSSYHSHHFLTFVHLDFCIL